MVNILTLCFTFEEEPSRTALELVAGARRLAGMLPDSRVQALLLGPKAAVQAKSLQHSGVDELLVVEDGRLQPHQATLMVDVAEKFIGEQSPAAVLLAHDILGSEVGPRLAYRLKKDIVTDCTGFKVEASVVHWLKPVYGGKALSYIKSNSSPLMVTFRARAFEPLGPDESFSGTVKTFDVTPDADCPIKLVDIIEQVEEGVSLDQAPVVVSGGRGIGGPEGFEKLEELAGVLGGAVGGSRPAADLGWIPHSRLIGQTGKIAAPDLYLAIGISGAPQHMAGAGASKTIVAINKDPDAPIFKAAHLGLVDEWQNVLPALTKACREMFDE